MKEYKQERDKGGMFTGRIVPIDVDIPDRIKNQQIERYEMNINSYKGALVKLQKAVERAKKNGEQRIYINSMITPDRYIGFGSVSAAEMVIDNYKNGISYYEREIESLKKSAESKIQTEPEQI